MKYAALVVLEIARVLKPNGVSVHMFPSCWTLVEGHVHVPLATFFRPYWYLLLWAWVGVRKRSQNGWSAIRTARHNRWYLTTATNYLSGRRIMDYAQRHFETRAFCERQAWLDASRIVRRFPFLRVVPVWWLRRTFRTRILLVAHPRHTNRRAPCLSDTTDRRPDYDRGSGPARPARTSAAVSRLR